MLVAPPCRVESDSFPVDFRRGTATLWLEALEGLVEQTCPPRMFANEGENEGETVPIQKITPFLWFDQQAEEAATFYASIFPNSKVVKVVRCGKGGPGPAGSVLTVEFQLQGQSFVALNGGPHFKFTEAISFVVNCQTQEEVDAYWNKLTSGGARSNAAG